MTAKSYSFSNHRASR